MPLVQFLRGSSEQHLDVGMDDIARIADMCATSNNYPANPQRA